MPRVWTNVEREKLETVYRAAVAMLVPWAAKYGVPRDVAHDALHKVILDLLKRWRTVPTRHTVLLCARRNLRDYIAWKKRHVPLGNGDSLAHPGPSASEAAEAREQSRLLREIVEAIPQVLKETAQAVSQASSLRKASRTTRVTLRTTQKRVKRMRSHFQAVAPDSGNF